MSADLERLVAEVTGGARYHDLAPSLVARTAAQELAKGRPWKETVKAVRSRLHQVGGAYQETAPRWAAWQAQMDSLPPQDDAALRAFLRRAMAAHSSTRERLPILERFFQETLAGLGPVHSVLDLACGLNPLAAPWMPLAPGAAYYACDVYAGMLDLLNHAWPRLGLAGEAFVCDLVEGVPQRPVDLVLLLKTIPCLEQLDPGIGPRLLPGLPARAALVSFPARSLGGRNKGMPEHYAAHFARLLEGTGWRAAEFRYPSELAYFLQRDE